MANASAWIGAGTGTAESDRADAALRRINEKPSSIVIKRGASSLSAQTVRVEYSTQQGTPEAKGGAGMSSTQRVIIFGIRGHRSEADTDIQRDDRIAIGGVQFRVVSVIPTTGEVQANLEAQT